MIDVHTGSIWCLRAGFAGWGGWWDWVEHLVKEDRSRGAFGVVCSFGARSWAVERGRTRRRRKRNYHGSGMLSTSRTWKRRILGMRRMGRAHWKPACLTSRAGAMIVSRCDTHSDQAKFSVAGAHPAGPGGVKKGAQIGQPLVLNYQLSVNGHSLPSLVLVVSKYPFRQPPAVNYASLSRMIIFPAD